MKKRTPKEVRRRTFITLGVGLLAALSGIAANEQALLIVMGLLTMFASMIFYAVFYRCPHCGKYLDRSTGEFCPYCSKKVNAGYAVIPMCFFLLFANISIALKKREKE